MALTQQTEHAGAAFARMPEQLKGKTNVGSFLTAFLVQVQELEDAFWEEFSERTIETAVGEQLDVLGRIVGEARQAKDDDTFRIYLRARIRLNRSSGTIPELLAIFEMLTGGTGDLSLIEYFPAAFELHVDNIVLTPTEAAAFGNFLQSAKAAGVGASFHWAESPAEDLFRFGSGAGFGTGVLSGSSS